MNIVSALTRLSISNIKPIGLTRSIYTNNTLYFHTSPCLLAEPLKKKKRLDPAVIKAREERRKKKLEKQIRRLEKNSRQFKPIEECEVPLDITDNEKLYARPNIAVLQDVLEQRILLEKKWAKHKRDQHLADIQMLDRIAFSQQRALDELQKESEELYQEAIQVDLSLLPYKSEGPVNTPPIKGYEAPDGDYLDVSKKW